MLQHLPIHATKQGQGAYINPARPNHEAIGDHPTLPDGVERDGFLRIFREVAKSLLQLSNAEINTFYTIASRTRPRDWKDPKTEPCCYNRQCDLARDEQTSRWSMARHEKRLVQKGLIDKRTMASGQRAGFVGCGLFLSKAIALYPTMLAYKQQLTEQAKHHGRLCTERSIHKGHCKAALAELAAANQSCPELDALTEAFSEWPDARQLRAMPFDQLKSHVYEADQLTRSVLSLLQKTLEMHHGGSINAPPYIQDTTKESIFVCSQKVTRTDCKQSDYIKRDTPEGASTCLDKQHNFSSERHQNEYHTKLGGSGLYDLCSANMQMYLAARMGSRLEPTPHDIECAAHAILPELGIHSSAWTEACQAMGPALAAICVILTDARTDDPVSPVREAGGYLRALTRTHKRGELNIIGSLIGLSERRARERTPH